MVKFEACAIFLLSTSSVLALQLPSDFKRCPASLKNKNDCLKDAVQSAFVYLKHGLPEFNFPGIEPVNIPSMTIGEGTGTVHVVQNFKNVKVYGISSMKVDHVVQTTTDDGSKMVTTGVIDEIRLEADYNLNGKILILPVYGEGKCVIKLTNTTIITTSVSKHYNKKETVYSKVEDFIVSIDPDKVHFQFDNLFNGDKALGEQINNILNDQSKEVYADIRKQYEEAFGIIFKNYANLIYEKVPLNDLYPIEELKQKT